MSAAPKLLTLTCSESGSSFEATRRDAKSCSMKCRQYRCRRVKAEVSEEIIEQNLLDHRDAENMAANAMAALRFLRRKFGSRDDL